MGDEDAPAGRHSPLVHPAVVGNGLRQRRVEWGRWRHRDRLSLQRQPVGTFHNHKTYVTNMQLTHEVAVRGKAE